MPMSVPQVDASGGAGNTPEDIIPTTFAVGTEGIRRSYEEDGDGDSPENGNIRDDETMRRFLEYQVASEMDIAAGQDRDRPSVNMD